jgi:phenylacetate-CoA ligase
VEGHRVVRSAYARVLRSVLYPAWETFVRRRPTLARVAWLERTQWRSLDELLAIQTGALRRLVAHAYTHVPYWRARFEAAGASPRDIRSPDDLLGLPVMDRQAARVDPDERASAGGPRATIRKTTGGTTGEPLAFGYEPDSEHWRLATKLRGYAWAGYRVGDSAIHYWGFPSKRKDAPLRAKIRVDRWLRRERYFDATLRDEAYLARIVDAIRTGRPDVLVCYTQAAADLARFVLATGARDWDTIPVICGAERLFDHDRDVIEQAFGHAVFETYGCREVMLIGAECEHHDGLHESMENVLVEIVVRGEGGRARHARPGESGEVVLTDLHNYAMPFLRYANGDVAIAGPVERCACGRGLRRIRAVDGRVTETLRDGDGRPVGGMVFNLIFSALAKSVRQFQAVQHKDGAITVKVVPASGLDGDAIEQVRSSCARYLRGVPVRVETVAEIPLSRSGKRRPVIVES